MGSITKVYNNKTCFGPRCLYICVQSREFVRASRNEQTARRKNYHQQITFEIISGTRKNQ